MNSIALLYITYADKKQAEHLIHILLEERWVACANLLPIEAIYSWKGKVEHTGEIASILKTTPALVPQLLNRIEELHPYEVPCIIHWEVASNPSYAKWVEESTRTA